MEKQRIKVHKKFTVYFEQTNRTNYQVIAEDKNEAYRKACKLYIRNVEIPLSDVEKGWIKENDGEDK